MKKRLISLLITIGLILGITAGFPTASFAADEVFTNNVYNVSVYSSDGYCNVRSGPGKGYEVIGTVGNGASLRLTAVTKNSSDELVWGKTEANGTSGWISVRLTSVNDMEAVSQAVYDVTVTQQDYIVLRKGPGTEYDELYRPYNGQVLRIDRTMINSFDGRPWGRTSINGMQGWVSLNWTVRNDPNVYNQYQDVSVQNNHYTAVISSSSGSQEFRSGAGAGNESLYTIRNDSTLYVTEVLQSSTDGLVWGKAVYGGSTGWIVMNETAIPDIDNACAAQYYVTVQNSGEIALRKGPGQEYEVLSGGMSNGTGLLITETVVNSINGSPWGKTQVNGMEGWVSLNCTTRPSGDVLGYTVIADHVYSEPEPETTTQSQPAPTEPETTTQSQPEPTEPVQDLSWLNEETETTTQSQPAPTEPAQDLSWLNEETETQSPAENPSVAPAVVTISSDGIYHFTMEDISAGASAEIEGLGSLSFTGFKHQDSVTTREDTGTSAHSAGDDAEFVCLYFDITNSGSEAVNYASDVQVIADQTEGKKYGGWMYPADDSSGEMVFVTNSENEESFAVRPSETGHYVAGVTLPKEVMQGSQEVTFKIRIGEAKIAVDLTDDQSEPEMEPAAVEDSVQAENTDSERTEVQTEVQTDTSVQEKKEAEDPYQGLLNDQVHYFSYNEFDFILNFSEKYYNFFIDDHTEDYQVSLDRMGMSAQEAQELLDQDGCELLAFPVGATKDSFHFKVFFSCWTYDEQDTSSDAFQDYCLNSGECFSEKCENLALLGTEPKGAYTYDVYSCNIGDRYYYSFLTLCDGVVLKMDCLYRDEQGEKEGLEAIDYILSRTINSQYNETGNYYRENGPGRDQQVWMDDNNPKNGCFINGMVWIDYDGQHWGLMDETGVVVYSVGIYELIETHEMGEDGLTYIKTNSNDQEEFVAIDRDGEEKFRLTCPEDTELEILGHGNHTFLVYERTAGFSEVNESLYVLDEDGNQIGDSVSVSSGVYSCEFLDPDLYILTFKDERYNSAENYYVYNISTGELFKLSGSTRIHMPFYNGESFINVYLEGEDLYGKITHEDLQSPQAWETWLETKAQPGQHDYDIYDYREEGMFLNDYPYNRESDRIYDYDGNEVSLDMFPANVEVNYYGDYSGGYKMLLLTGADGHSYVTVIDRAGNQLYEPVKVEEDRDGKEQSHGYVLYRASGKYHLIDRTGAEEILDIDDYGSVTRFDGKYLYCRDIIYDVIQKRFVFAYYRDGIPSVDYSDNADTYEPEKIYSDISNFNITGKWKNTGSDDYGQAQSGAIVVFDGKNCNFYSPNDTYAFYKEGDHYRLDCTSMLFADTVSFVVNTVDQGHIDIEFSGGIVELTRVE